MMDWRKWAEPVMIGFAAITLLALYGQVSFAPQLVVVSLATLGMYYLLSGGLVLFDSRVERVMRFLYFVGLWSMANGLIGLIFRLRFWQRGDILLMMGIAFGAVVMLVSLFYRQTTPIDRRPAVIQQFTPLLRRLTIYPILFFVFYLWPTESLYRHFGEFRHNETYVRTFLDAWQNPQDSIKQVELEVLDKQIREQP